ncbi:MAG: phenylalanine--tRNA ligase beta subunit-related protein [Patescibacteria group bacterium]
MTVIIQKEIHETFDHPVIGVIDCQGIDNIGNPAEIQDMLRRAEADARRMFSQYESHGLHPHLSAWRKAYKQFGADPHQYRCSAESLARRVLKGDSVPHINTLVDLYNYISLKYVIPVGGEDADAIRGDVQLAFAEGTEQFIRLNGTENEPPFKGEVVYKDDESVLCRRWNWREADRTKLTPRTANAVIVLDGLAPLNRAEMERVVRELSELIGTFCGGEQKGMVF